MAGEFPVPANPSSGRKQWKIYRGHRGPFRRLGTELAEDGCPDSQVMYAKQLLEEKCDDDVDQEENDRLGVYWLLKASEQGHEEATRMLHRCLETGQGISEHNIGDVKSCLDMPLVEKRSRHAAREMFASLSQGEDFITSDQLSEEMLRVQEQPHCSRTTEGGTVDRQNLQDWKTRVRLGVKSEKLTEDMLVSAASHYSRGYLPIVHRALMLERPVRRRSFLGSVVAAPLGYAIASYRRLIDSLAHRPFSHFYNFFFGNIQLFLLFAIYSVFGVEGLLDMIPSCIYYGSFFIMLITSCQILSKKWESRHFKQWSNLLVAWGGNGVNANDAQWAHCINNMKPCFHFLLSLLLNLSFIPFVPVLNVPHSELAVLSTFCSFVMLYNFMWKNGKLDLLVLFSFGIHVFARYPYDLDPVVSQDWRFLDVHVPTFASFVVGNGVEFCLNFRLFFYILLPMMMLKMASRDNWRGFFTTFIPHVICLSWWQMAVISSNGATWYGLIRACLGLFGVILFLPLAGLSTVVFPVAALIKSMMSVSVIPLPATVVLSLASLISAIYFAVKYKRTSSHKITWIQVILVGGSCWVLVNWAGEGSMIRPNDTITWSQYRTLCNSQSTTAAANQANCAQFAGLYVSWEGTVSSASISSVYNPLTPLVNKLPQSLQETVKCMYGEKYADCVGTPECVELPALKNRCHLSNWNRYEYEIEVLVKKGGMWIGDEEKAILSGGNPFTNLTLGVSPGDKIWFTGVLVNDGPKVRVSLVSGGCVLCAKPVATASLPQSPDSSSLASSAANSLLHFFLSPLVNFN